MADEPQQEQPEDEPKHAMKKVMADLVALTRDLVGRQLPEEQAWFRNVLVGILNATHQNYQSVEIGVAKMPTLASWGARNLLELRVITLWVLRSEADALAFKDDFAADLKEFWEAMKASDEYVHKKLVAEMRAYAQTQHEFIKPAFLAKAKELEDAGPNVKGPVEEAETYRRLMQEFGIDPRRKPAQGSKIAAMVNESEMFKPRFKIHSKLVHPTALSIAASIMPNSLDQLMPLISSEASNDVLAIFFAIKDHVDKYGIGWSTT